MKKDLEKEIKIELHDEIKKEFQLERLILFSDAVFAIAITLLIIEIKVPELHEEISDSALLHEMIHLIPKFLGFIISFVIIGVYWSVHHRMFGYVLNYDKGLIVRNMFFLFAIVLMPFSTAMYSEYAAPRYINLITPYSVYVFNICLVGLGNYLLLSYVSNLKNQIVAKLPHEYVRGARIRTLLIPIAFLLSLLVTFWSPIVGKYVPIIIPIATRLLKIKRV